MQKKLIALAIAGLSSAAFAQSNVTIYGVADATYDFINVKDGATANSNVGGYSRVSTNSSLIGFKGVEDLGNGLKAVFQYESAVGFDGGAAGAFASSRDSFVALAGGFGTVALGNLTGPTRAFGGAVDVNDGATGIGTNGAIIGKLGNVLNGTLNSASLTNTVLAQVTNASRCGRSQTCVGVFDDRFANAIAYISPEMGGFTAIVGYVPNENKGGSTTNTSQPNTSAYDLGLKYANGPVLVGLSHADAKTKNSVDTATSITRLVGSYDFGVANVRLLWDQTKVSITGADAKQTDWGLGATFPVGGAGKILAQYYVAKDVNGSAGLGAASDTGARLFELGYEHSLSKRTMVKVNYARLASDDHAAYDFGINATGTGSVGVTPGNLGETLSGLSIGLRHKF